jgi:hypothetical protein
VLDVELAYLREPQRRAQPAVWLREPAEASLDSRP